MSKWFGIDIIRSLAKIAGVGLLFFAISFAVGFTLSQTVVADSTARAANIILEQPTYNWFVCEDLGLGTVPGVPGLRQILRLCHNQGWEIRAYCLQPSLPAPPIGTTCSHTEDGPYWCGDSYQLLEEFILDVTPTSTPLPTVTNTAIPTQTPQTSATIAPSQTSSATFTPTEILTDTPPPTFTPRLTNSATWTPTSTNTPAPSVTGTILATQTPLASLTDVPITSITPSLTPQGLITLTPANATETAAATLSVTPGEGSETPNLTETLLPSTPTATPRTRPGGSGNLGKLSFAGIYLSILSFAIGFLSLLLIKNSKLEFRISHNPGNSSQPGNQRTIRISRWLLLLMTASLVFLVGYLILVWVPQFINGQPPITDLAMRPSLSSENSLTATPYQPRHPTPVYTQVLERKEPPTFNFQKINFKPQSGRLNISIDPPSPLVNQGKPINISFIPAETCDFGDQQACVSTHVLDKSNLIFLTVHSGYGGEGQAFRHAVEGTGINRAAFSLSEVNNNLTALQDAQVSVTAHGDEVGGMSVRGVIRIPAAHVDAYFNLPIEDALVFAASLNPEVWSTIDQSQPLLIFETCGWKLPAEPGSAEVSDTTGSVYMIAIQPIP